MPTKVVWSNLAQQTLLDIYVALGLENLKAADRWYDRLKDRGYQLADQPRMGPRRTDIGPEIRGLIETPYLILYRTRPDDDESLVDVVEIITVVDGRRDLERLSLDPAN